MTAIEESEIRQEVEVIRVRGLRKVFRDFWLRPRVEAPATLTGAL